MTYLKCAPTSLININLKNEMFYRTMKSDNFWLKWNKS